MNTTGNRGKAGRKPASSPKKSFRKKNDDQKAGPKRTGKGGHAGTDKPLSRRRPSAKDGAGRRGSRTISGDDKPKILKKRGAETHRSPETKAKDEGRPKRKRISGVSEFSIERPFKKKSPRAGREEEHDSRRETKKRGASFSLERPFAGKGFKDKGRARDDSGGTRDGGLRLKKSKGREDGLIRLNKYIADAGICSRREADDLISSGAVKVNGIIVTTLGTKVSPNDRVQVGDQTLSRETLRYVLLNKPKGVITTMDDPQDRDTVMSLVHNACRERIYPVGRLDRNTTGVLLLTNDGELAKRLTHPRYGIRKVYHVFLEQNLEPGDMEKIEEGMELDDGFIKVDAIDYVGGSHKELGIEIHSGRNRIVRRIFETLGYKITKLDRVVFAGLTKKDLPRGKWRHLTQQEVNFLKMLS